jgi:hypothetical protein
LTIIIYEDTVALDEAGEPLKILEAEVDESPPAQPENKQVIGLAYDLGPDGATFAPPLVLTFSYDNLDIPEDTNEGELVIAFWDEDAEEWVELNCEVDTDTNTITAEVSHFTTFIILADTNPACFTVSDLSITPAEVSVGQTVNITALVANTSDLSGTYEVVLKVDNIAVAAREVTLAGGDSETVSFGITMNDVATHTVSVGGLSGTFKIIGESQGSAAFSFSDLSVSPAEIQAGENVNISVSVVNTGDLSGGYQVKLIINDWVVETKKVTLAAGESKTIVFNTTKDTAGTYEIDIGGLSASFLVKEVAALPTFATPSPQPPVRSINWFVIGGVIAGVVLVGLAIFVVVRGVRY